MSPPFLEINVQKPKKQKSANSGFQEEIQKKPGKSKPNQSANMFIIEEEDKEECHRRRYLSCEFRVGLRAIILK